MTVIVTGGAGFIGSHLCESLLSKGHKVVAIDNYITGNPRNVAHLKNNKNFELIEHDVSKVLKAKLPVAKQIFHLAGPASPDDYVKYPIETLLANSQGTFNALELAKKNKARIVIASTSEVYGDPLEHPQSEEYWGNVNCIGPRSCYDESKRFSEALSMAFMRKHKVNIGIVRIFNTYGERMRSNDGRVVPNFVAQALENKDITIYGDGLHTRSFCYVSDLVRGLQALMDSQETGPINIGNPQEMTVIELAKKIKEITKSKSKLEFKSLPTDDPHRRRPDISKAKSLLGWEPIVSLEEGLGKTLNWFSGAEAEPGLVEA